MLWIGIDPGTHTGLSVWDGKKFQVMSTMPIHDALEYVTRLSQEFGSQEIFVVFEDARQRTWYGEKSSAKLQGAGSIKRDCSIWEDFLHDHHIQFQAVPPQKGATKLTPEYFSMITGWTKKTSNHARDAAMLVLGR